MKVLIQDSETRRFLTNRGGWTTSPEEAEDFLLAVRAHDLAVRRTSRHFQILFYFQESNSFLQVMHGHGKASAAALVCA